MPFTLGANRTLSRHLGIELLKDRQVERAFERYDQSNQFRRRNPLPVREFGMFGGDVDVGIPAREAHEKPFLQLPAPAAVSCAAHHVVRQFILKPGTGARHDLDQFRAEFFLQFT